MASFVNPASPTHQGAERATQMFQALRSAAVALLSFPLQVLSAIPEGWNDYMTYLEKRESDDELMSLAQRDSRVMNGLMAAADRQAKH
ncbi:MAG: hypothetical protein GAK30_01218 [Paracidovorax wautersii]|uniref:Uncharacterized protein n=1 Tax=Paracidovorax wautersii TaxID=1177982 RepID=A0A7V8FQF7_9BURK|nr:MAG: hypothetical protein GAK30_01218 [Paracidovorax wautersii]